MSDIEFAHTGDTHLAYRVIGSPGRVDVVMVAGGVFPFELLAEDRVAARFVAGLGALGRVVVFDKRGVGLSDPVTDWSSLLQEQWGDDLIAVTEAAELDRPVVVSWEAFGAARSAVSARPDLFAALVLINPAPITDTFRVAVTEHDELLPGRRIETLAFPSRIEDEEFTAWIERSGRAGASPTSATRIWTHLLGHPGPLTPPDLAIPTLVLHNRDCMQPLGAVEQVANAIPGAELVEVPGGDVYPVAGDVDPLIAEIAEFVTGRPSDLTPERHLAAILFTDLVDSTRRAAQIGDQHWRDLLDVHDRTVRQCVHHHGGRVVKYTGDGILALMPSAQSALETIRAIGDVLSRPGLTIRSGVHVGDVDVRGDDVSGLAVNLASRIMARAGADETLVSEATRIAMLGSGHTFDEVETTDLKGIPGRWSLHRWTGEEPG